MKGSSEILQPADTLGNTPQRECLVEFGRTVVADGRFEQVFRTIGVVEPADKARTAHFRRAAVGELILESSGEQIRDGGRRETGPLRRDPAVVVVDQLVQQKSLQVVVLGESTFVVQRELGRQPLSLAGLLSQLFLEGERLERVGVRCVVVQIGIGQVLEKFVILGPLVQRYECLGRQAGTAVTSYLSEPDARIDWLSVSRVPLRLRLLVMCAPPVPFVLAYGIFVGSGSELG